MSDALLEAEELLEQLPAAVTRRTLGERLSKSLSELSTADRQIQRMRIALEITVLIKFGGASHQRKLLTEMVNCAQSVGKALEEASDAEDLREAVYDYSTDLKQAISALEQSIREHWRVVAIERFQPLVGFGQLLSSVNVPNKLGDRLTSCGQRGVASANAGSFSDLLAAVKSLFSEYDALQAERAAEISEDEVGDFLNALAEKRATLAMVTPRVRDWLANHGALERLGITAR
jgi:hypothetical protein